MTLVYCNIAEFKFQIENSVSFTILEEGKYLCMNTILLH